MFQPTCVTPSAGAAHPAELGEAFRLVRVEPPSRGQGVADLVITGQWCTSWCGAVAVERVDDRPVGRGDAAGRRPS